MESACTKKEPEGSFSHAEVRRMSDVPISILTGGRRPSFIFSRSRFAAAFPISCLGTRTVVSVGEV